MHSALLFVACLGYLQSSIGHCVAGYLASCYQQHGLPVLFGAQLLSILPVSKNQRFAQNKRLLCLFCVLHLERLEEALVCTGSASDYCRCNGVRPAKNIVDE